MPSDHTCEQSGSHKVATVSIDTGQVQGVQLLERHDTLVAYC